MLSHRTCSGLELLLNLSLQQLIDRVGVVLLCLGEVTMCGAGATVVLLSVAED